MSINLYGLGNVGLVIAASLADKDFFINGIDIHKEKIDILKKDELYFYEPGLKSLLEKNSNRLNFSQSPKEEAKVSIICVGTPIKNDGQVNLDQIYATLKEVKNFIKDQNHHCVILRSTVPPGTCSNKIIPFLEKETNKKKGEDFSFAYMPEFLREGSSLSDFQNSSGNICADEIYNDKTQLENLFGDYTSVQLKTAEMIKYINNSFHALKVTYSNEVFTIAKKLGVDTDELYNIFINDESLNISSAYLRPGFAYGGSCFHKDLKTLTTFGKDESLWTPGLVAIEQSNCEHINRLARVIENLNIKSLFVCGLSFKQETSDLRNSPIVRTINLLLKGPTYLEKMKIGAYDKFVNERDLSHLNLSILKEEEEAIKLIGDYEAIILGPCEVSSSFLEKIGELNLRYIDLKYFINRNLKPQNEISFI